MSFVGSSPDIIDRPSIENDEKTANNFNFIKFLSTFDEIVIYSYQNVHKHKYSHILMEFYRRIVQYA